MTDNLITCNGCHETVEGDSPCRCRRETAWAARNQAHIVRCARLRLQYISEPEAVLEEYAGLLLPDGTGWEIHHPIGAIEPIFIITTIPPGAVL